MCQMRVLIVDEVGEELVMENVISLQVSGDSIEVGAFFEEPRRIDAVCIQSIDFLGGQVLLKKKLPDELVQWVLDVKIHDRGEENGTDG